MIYATYICSEEESYAPPEMPLLEIAVVDDVVFLSQVTIEETSKAVTFTRVGNSIAINASELVNTLNIMIKENIKDAFETNEQKKS